MSWHVSREVWKYTEASGNDLAVLLCLADHVNDEAFKRGDPWLAYPAQQRIADRCRCSVATVKRSLKWLVKEGEIACVGTKYRGVKIYEVLPLDADATSASPGADVDLAQSDLAQVELGGAGEAAEGADLAQSGSDLAQVDHHLAQVEPPGSSTLDYKPRREPTKEPIIAEPDARATARATGLSPASSGEPSGPTPAQKAVERQEDERELKTLEKQRASSPWPDSVDRAISDLRQRLGLQEATA